MRLKACSGEREACAPQIQSLTVKGVTEQWRPVGRHAKSSKAMGQKLTMAHLPMATLRHEKAPQVSDRVAMDQSSARARFRGNRYEVRSYDIRFINRSDLDW